MNKVLYNGSEARKKLKKGLDKVVDAVKVTIGPKGRNIALEGGFEPIIANDALTIAKDIILKDSTENMGASLAKEIIRKTSEKVGGGRTASAIIYQSIIDEGLKYVELGVNVNSLKEGIKKASKDVQDALTKLASPIESVEHLKNVAQISTESKELGDVIGEVVYKVGSNGIITVEDSDSLSYEYEADGIRIDKGWLSPYFVTNEQMEAEYKDTPILLVDRKISSYKEFFPLLQRVQNAGKNELVIFCEDMDGDVLPKLILAKLQGMFKTLVVKTPGFGDSKREWLEDMASCLDATIVSETTGVTFETVKLGLAKKVKSTKDHTEILGGDTKEQVKKLQDRLKDLKGMDKDKMEKRIAILTNKVAKIKIGASTESELRYLKLKIEDGINESKRALEDGIIPGGDIGYIWASKGLEKQNTDDEAIGYNVLLRAVSAPLKQIVHNAGGKPDVVVALVEQGNKYDAFTNSIFKDERGIVDAVKVAKVVLENAASGASMFLTIEGSIAKDEENTNG